MTYEEACAFKKQHLDIIGHTDERGFKIGDVVIVPSDKNSRTDFFANYVCSNDPVVSLEPFKEEDLEVWAIDTEHLINANILFFKKLG